MNDDGYLAAGYKKDAKGIYRNAKGHLAPGQVINPTGQNLSPERKEFRRLMTDASFPLFQVLYELAHNEETTDQIKLMAIKEIFDRAWGKSQTVFGDGDATTYKPQPIVIADLQRIIDHDEDITNDGEKLDYVDDE